MSAPARAPGPVTDRVVSVRVDETIYPVRDRTARHIVLWLLEHQDDLPSYGHLQVDLTPGEFRARVLRSFEPVKFGR